MFSMDRDTSESPSARRVAVPLKITFSIFSERSSRARCSPSTHRTASMMFDFPHPFGPTMAVTPGSKWMEVLSAKLLKPWSSMLLRYMRRAAGAARWESPGR